MVKYKRIIVEIIKIPKSAKWLTTIFGQFYYISVKFNEGKKILYSLKGIWIIYF